MGNWGFEKKQNAKQVSGLGKRKKSGGEEVSVRALGKEGVGDEPVKL